MQTSFLEVWGNFFFYHTVKKNAGKSVSGFQLVLHPAGKWLELELCATLTCQQEIFLTTSVIVTRTSTTSSTKWHYRVKFKWRWQKEQIQTRVKPGTATSKSKWRIAHGSPLSFHTSWGEQTYHQFITDNWSALILLFKIFIKYAWLSYFNFKWFLKHLL